jgi:flagellar motility protein MotE (MotC chaperone)
MAETPQGEKSISQEFNRLGKQVADAIHAAWESEDRKKLQDELTEGLQNFEAQVDEALKKAMQSDTAKQLQQQTEKVVTQVRESGVSEEVRKGLIGGLEVVNKELGKLVEKLEPKGAAQASGEAVKPDAPESPPPAAPPPAA